MLPEDLAVELAEDREWEAIKDAVEQGREDLDEDGNGDPRERAQDQDPDEGPRFQFVDEEGDEDV